MNYILAKNRDIEEHKQICNQIYFEATQTPLSCSKTVHFETVKKTDKTNLQLRGIHRICNLYAIRLSEDGRKVSQASAKVKLKYEADFVRLASYGEALEEAMKIKKAKEAEKGQAMTMDWFEKLLSGLQKHFFVPKSFAEASKQEMMQILKFVKEEFVENKGWHEMVLLPAEYRDLMERF